MINNLGYCPNKSAFLENSSDFGSQSSHLRVNYTLGLDGQTQRTTGSWGSYLVSRQLLWRLSGEASPGKLAPSLGLSFLGFSQ